MKTLISPYNDLMNDLLDATAFSLKPSSRIFSQLDFWQEKEDGFYVEKDIPGFSKKDVKATLENNEVTISCLLYTSPSPRDGLLSRMPSSA